MSVHDPAAMPADAPQPGLSRAEFEATLAKTPFATLLGARPEAFGEGHASLSLRLQGQLTMHLGFAHGAVVGFLADSACAWAAASIGGNVVTAEYKINLIAPGVGEVLMAEGRVLKASGRSLICQAEVFAIAGGESSLIAVALATLHRLKQSDDAPSTIPALHRHPPNEPMHERSIATSIRSV